MIKRNFVKEKLKQGLPVMGTWNTLASPLVTEILGQAGFDFVIIDFEHGPADYSNIASYVNAAEINQCSPIVRVSSQADWQTLQALDQGAHGIIVPHVDTLEELKSIIDNAKYAPLGKRGFTPFTKAGGFSSGVIENYTEEANNFNLISIIIESKKGLQNLDKILSCKELDVVYLGSYDLSQDLGVPGQVRHPLVVKEITDAVVKIKAAGKFAGGFLLQNEEDAKWLINMGMQFLLFDVDSSILYRPIKKMTDFLKGQRN